MWRAERPDCKAPFASVHVMTSEERPDNQQHYGREAMSNSAASSAEVADHYRRWLAGLPDVAPDMSVFGRDGNLYYDDDERFWSELLQPKDSG